MSDMKRTRKDSGQRPAIWWYTFFSFNYFLDIWAEEKINKNENV